MGFILFMVIQHETIDINAILAIEVNAILYRGL